MLSKITENTVAILMAISLLLNNFVPIMTVFAAAYDKFVNAINSEPNLIIKKDDDSVVWGDFKTN